MSERLQRSLRRRLRPVHDDGDACSLRLYRFAAGELAADEENAFRAHLASCEACQADLDLAQQIERDARAVDTTRGKTKVWRWLGYALAPAALAATLLLLVIRAPGDGGDDAEFKIKGTYSLQVGVQRGTQRFSGQSGASYQDGDVLGFFYTAPEPRYVYVLFSDENAEVTRIYPTGAATLLPAGVELALPHGAVLEPGQGCEWIVTVFADRPRPSRQIEQHVRRAVRASGAECQLGDLQIGDASVDVFVLRREQP